MNEEVGKHNKWEIIGMVVAVLMMVGFGISMFLMAMVPGEEAIGYCFLSCVLMVGSLALAARVSDGEPMKSRLQKLIEPIKEHYEIYSIYPSACIGDDIWQDVVVNVINTLDGLKETYKCKLNRENNKLTWTPELTNTSWIREKHTYGFNDGIKG